MTRFEKAETIVGLLQNQNRHITFAESCTGGRAAAGIVDVPSASAVLDVSFVTYANEAKVQFVNVSADTIAAYGVVSEPVAGEMAAGCAKAASAQVGVGISGIAGPGGGTDENPVGTVYIALATPFGVTCKRFSAPSDANRTAVRKLATLCALEMLEALL